MNKQIIMKWTLPGLLMSALTFELRHDSVATDLLMIPEKVCNFFSPPVEGMAASCLMLAGVATIIAMVLALVALCFKKNDLYKLTSWCSLAAASLASVPYIVRTEEAFMQPNVVIIILLTVCWLLAMVLDKKKDVKEEATPKGRRL